MDWSSILTTAGVMTGIVGGLQAMVVVYLRAIREDQRQLRQEHAALAKRVQEIETGYTTHEEWVREAGINRQRDERILELLLQVNQRLESESSMAAQTQAWTRAMQTNANTLNRTMETVQEALRAMMTGTEKRGGRTIPDPRPQTRDYDGDENE